jgi:RimJ/RimL family protein N-acetyltransferase
VPSILTQRLELVPATEATTRAALAGSEALANALGAMVPPTWPPEYMDAPALEYTLARLSEGPEQSGWWLHFVVLRSEVERTLVGSAGYKGPPSQGRVEIGYGIVSSHRRRGYATEAARALIARAFETPGVTCVLAETLPELTPSIGVLEKCGFRLVGEGSEPSVIRFELARR